MLPDALICFGAPGLRGDEGLGAPRSARDFQHSLERLHVSQLVVVGPKPQPGGFAGECTQRRQVFLGPFQREVGHFGDAGGPRPPPRTTAAAREISLVKLSAVGPSILQTIESFYSPRPVQLPNRFPWLQKFPRLPHFLS